MKNGKIAVLNIKVKTESHLNLPEITSLKEMMSHWWGERLISVDVQEGEEKDNREKPDPPEICQQCKNCHNKQCWFGDYFNMDLDGDVDVCFDAKTGNTQEILDKYWENIAKLIAKNQV